MQSDDHVTTDYHGSHGPRLLGWVLRRIQFGPTICVTGGLLPIRPAASSFQKHFERYRQSLLYVLGGKLRTTGEMFRCAVGMEELLTNTRVRISTEGLAPLETLEFVHNHLIHYLYARRSLAPRVDPPDLAALVVIEEAQTFLQPRTSGIPYYQEILLRSRNMGLGFILVVQDLGRIDPTICAACSNFFLFAQPSAAFAKHRAAAVSVS